MSWITKLGNKCHVLYHLKNPNNIKKLLQPGMQKLPLLSSQVHTLGDLGSSKILQIIHSDSFKGHYQILYSGNNGYQICQNTCLHLSSCKNNKKIDTSQVPILNEEDLEESFVRGSGPGGQSVNRTSSACMLKHIPTGLVVKCHEDRNLHKNRITARKWMVAKLDELYNGNMSVAAQQKRIQEEKNAKAQQKAKKKQMMKKAWKEREGLTDN